MMLASQFNLTVVMICLFTTTINTSVSIITHQHHHLVIILSHIEVCYWYPHHCVFFCVIIVICFSGGSASADAVEKLAGSAHLLQAAAWKLAGNRSLSQASALTHLACYSETASSEDRALAYAQLAHVAMSKKGYK